jgi:hypothetical protein
LRGAPVPLAQSPSLEQFGGAGRVSSTHAPWSQNFPGPHSGSALQLATHEPETHFGAAAFVHSASPVQPWFGPGPFGSHTPFVQVKPWPQEAASQPVRHWPSAQILPVGQSLEYLHVFVVAVHAPATHAWSGAQSEALWQGHGPAVPPHAWHALLTQTLPLPQSVFVVHSLVGPGVDVGAEQTPDLHTVPFGQVASFEHVCAHPPAVHTWPLSQLDVPVHGFAVGAVTPEQP